MPQIWFSKSISPIVANIPKYKEEHGANLVSGIHSLCI
jgi:hypothetical protein